MWTFGALCLIGGFTLGLYSHERLVKRQLKTMGFKSSSVPEIYSELAKLAMVHNNPIGALGRSPEELGAIAREAEHIWGKAQHNPYAGESKEYEQWLCGWAAMDEKLEYLEARK
jgi:hypothetical protein